MTLYVWYAGLQVHATAYLIQVEKSHAMLNAQITHAQKKQTNWPTLLINREDKVKVGQKST